jgi:transposase
MFFNNNAVKVWICNEAVDFRKQIDGLSMFIADSFNMQPTSGELFVFYNPRRDKIKILYWDNDGFALWYKRLEKSKFIIPQNLQTPLAINPKQLQWLLEGFDLSKFTCKKNLEYKDFF